MKYSKYLLSLSVLLLAVTTACQGGAKNPQPAAPEENEIIEEAPSEKPVEELLDQATSLYANDLTSSSIQEAHFTIERGAQDIYPLLTRWYQLEYDLWVKGVEHINAYTKDGALIKPQPGNQFWMLHVAFLNRSPEPAPFFWNIGLEMKNELAVVINGKTEDVAEDAAEDEEILTFDAQTILFKPQMELPIEEEEKYQGYALPNEMMNAYVIYEVPSRYTYRDVYALQGKLTTQTFENRELTLFATVFDEIPNHQDWLVVNGALYIQGDHVVSPEYMQAAIRGESVMSMVKEQVPSDTPLTKVKNGDASVLPVGAKVYPLSNSMVLNALYSAVVVQVGEDEWHYYYRPPAQMLDEALLREDPAAIVNTQCITCHAVEGRTPRFMIEGLDELSDEEILNQIRNGSKGMPSFEQYISEEGLNNLVQYLRELKK